MVESDNLKNLKQELLSSFINWVLFLIFLIAVILTIYLCYFYFNSDIIIDFFNLFNKSAIIKNNYTLVFAYPQIIATIGFSIAYIYFFYAVKRRGVSIVESNEIETKHFAFIFFIMKIFTGVIVLVAYCLYLFNENANEQLCLIVFFFILYVVVRTKTFKKYQVIMAKYTNIIDFITFLQTKVYSTTKWIFLNLSEILDIILLMTIFTAFIGIYREYNLFTILLFEFILVEIFFLVSIINKIPKYTVTIHTKTNQIYNSVFILYDSPKEYLMFLDENDKKTMICKSSINFIEKG